MRCPDTKLLFFTGRQETAYEQLKKKWGSKEKTGMRPLKGLAIVWGWVVCGYLLKTAELILKSMGYG